MDFADVRRSLEQRQQQLQKRVSRIEGDLRQPGNRDWKERATEVENDEVLEELGASERRELAEIERALARIDAGSYGRCERCQEPIGAARLEALLYATLCVDCAD